MAHGQVIGLERVTPYPEIFLAYYDRHISARGYPVDAAYRRDAYVRAGLLVLYGEYDLVSPAEHVLLEEDPLPLPGVGETAEGKVSRHLGVIEPAHKGGNVLALYAPEARFLAVDHFTLLWGLDPPDGQDGQTRTDQRQQ